MGERTGSRVLQWVWPYVVEECWKMTHQSITQTWNTTSVCSSCNQLVGNKKE
ncbi:hypothetical protein B0T16DRAFT_408193 [Cercophora newfieldiana]|uniref:Uncharacterized protein n=1 Tax=Cercophora newfieldiana TaxID=92897 RepID=A0AA39Y9B1_9PEZI|nr:hypothetical protein B0T16DRAFT_408193 [Cercophora newfieldiana]